jgi:hypothetical protein
MSRAWRIEYEEQKLQENTISGGSGFPAAIIEKKF